MMTWLNSIIDGFQIFGALALPVFVPAALTFLPLPTLESAVELTYQAQLIEVGQLTGLFFLFQGSYRLFDVDDLLCNTLGGLIGYLMICKARRFLPAISNFDRELVFKKRPAFYA